MTSHPAQAVFAEGGLLERSHPGFELRPGQIRMSEAVGDAIERRSHLLMEAPTGTGKTFAYLVPAIESGRKVIISTGTRNLQEQLFFKDIPALERVLGTPISAACMKGRDNYLCIKRFRDHQEEPRFVDMGEIEELDLMKTLSAWALETGTGDRAELGDLPDGFRLWDRINARADTCLGQRCPDYEPCFLTRMRREAAEAQVVVVNHHLLVADLVLKEHAFGQVIPDYSVLIVDEAHALEDVATAHLGRSISWRQVSELADDIEAALEDAAARRRANHLRDAAKSFFGMMMDRSAGSREAGRFLLDPWRADAGWAAAATALRESLGLCESLLREATADPDEASVATLKTRALEQAATLKLLQRSKRRAGPGARHVPDRGAGGDAGPAAGPTAGPDSGDDAGDDAGDRAGTGAGDAADPLGRDLVTWGETRGRGVVLHASPIDVSGPLRAMLFSRVPTVVLASATLAIDGSFDFVRGRLGLDEAEELILDTPFDPKRQAVLYVPKGFPEPSHAEFVPRLVAELRALLEVTSGRAFILFTSYANLRRVRDALSGSIPWPLLVQGDASRHALLERFRATPGAVLLATSSFWHGVDVQGDALSLVVIDKLPFDVPSDPIVSARIEVIRRAGGVPFRDYQIPAAVIDLKQGLGRLIRSRQDRGVLAVMDSRLLTRPYGRTFINSLPPHPLLHDLAAVKSFFTTAG